MSELPLMFPSASEQMVLFLWSCVMGAGFGAVYDVLRILRIAIRPSTIAVAIQDVFFLFFCAVCIFIFAVDSGGGMLRLFYIAGSILGFTLYYFTIGQLVYFAAGKIIGAIKWIFRQLFRIFLQPVINFFVMIQRKNKKLFMQFLLSFKKNYGNAKNRLKEHAALLYNKTKQTQKSEDFAAKGETGSDGKGVKRQKKKK